MSDVPPQVPEKRFKRERKARKQAEQLLEEKSRQLYESNTRLRNLADNLELMVAQRTRELTAMRDEALAGSRIKSNFLANMSHEIRTPISGIIGMAELLLEGPLGPEQHSQLSVVLMASQGLLAIINDILDLSKLEAGKLELEESEFDLSTLLDDVIDTVAQAANDKHLALGAILHTPVPAAVRADSLRLRQILINLMSNGIKFTEHGSVVLEVSQVGEDKNAETIMWRFVVSDTGIGIAEQDQRHLFKNFSQLGRDDIKRNVVKGTGLGLSICRTLVEKMRGQIGCDSIPAHGSAFWFTLSLRAGAQQCATQDWTNTPVLFGLITDALTQRLITAQATSLGIDCSLVQDIDTLRRSLATRQAGEREQIRVLLDETALSPDARSSRAALNGLLTNLPRPTTLLTGPTPRHEKQLTEDCLIRPLTHRKLLSFFKPSEHRPPQCSPEAAAPVARRKQRARILLAEDSPSLQLVYQTILRRAGYQVQLVANGREAISAVRTGDFDLVLMDIQMPEMNGIEATRQIRQLAPPLPANIPIIALTAFAMKGDEEEILQAGVDEYLTKPVERTKLEAALSRWLT